MLQLVRTKTTYLAFLLSGMIASTSFAADLLLTWTDNSTDETGFKIERSAGATGTFTQIATVGANIVTFRDTGLAEGASYRYRVRAYNAAGDSGYTNVVDHLIPVTNTPPTISVVATQTVLAGASTGPVAVQIADAQTAGAALLLSATSSNPALLPSTNLILGGSGNQRTITATALPGATGEASVTLTVSDGALASSSTFKVVVLNTAPTISALAARTLKAGATSSAIPFTVGDAETAASKLTVTRKSSHTAILPTAGISLGGSGANRTLTIATMPGVTGSSNVTVTVSDGSLTSTRTFSVKIEPANTAPTVSAIADQTLTVNTDTGPITFNVADKETAATALTITASSSNTALVPSSGIQLGGSGNERTVRVTPSQGRIGAATITISASDGDLTTKSTFILTVQNQAPTLLSIMDQLLPLNGASATIPLRIGDAETPADQLVVSVVSSNPSLLPAQWIALGGSGANRTLRLVSGIGLTGTATVVASVSDGTQTTSVEFTVAVIAKNGAPGINFHPTSRVTKSGSSVSLSVSAFGGPAPTYQWRHNGQAIAGATSSTYTMSKAQAANAGIYDVVVQNSKGSVTSRPAVVLIDSPVTPGMYAGSFGTYANWSMLLRPDLTALHISSSPVGGSTLAIEVEMKSDRTGPVVHTAVSDYLPLN